MSKKKTNLDSATHSLRDCVVAKKLWSLVTIPHSCTPSFNKDIHVWLKSNSLSHCIHISGACWNIVFLLTIWHVWLLRNSLIHRDTQTIPPEQTRATIISKALEWQFLIQPTRAEPSRAQPTLTCVGWRPPPHGSYKLNIDGNGCTLNSEACAGELI